MGSNKKELVRFLAWMRNGIAFCTSWFLILWLLYNRLWKIEEIATDDLISMLLFVIGGVFIFSVIFTNVVLKRWRFMSRLNCFMILFSIYECIAFYHVGLWNGSGVLAAWFVFVGIILVSYLACSLIYRLYSRKKGDLYTQALQKYQQKRSDEHEK